MGDFLWFCFGDTTALFSGEQTYSPRCSCGDFQVSIPLER